MQSKLTLLMPGLLQPPLSLQGLSAGDKPPFKLLNRFFSRAKQSRIPVSGFYNTLFHLFGIETAARRDLPVAALTRLADCGIQNDEWCLRCDPVYIHADMDRAILMAHGAMGLTVEESEQLLCVINAHVQQDGWQIEAHAVERWYIRGAERRQLETTQPHEVLGQDIKHDLPQGADGAYWCAIMNECQMLLHDAPVNLDRQARGLPPVNSLWFWGEGQLPATTNCPYDRVFADDVLVKGLAMQGACPHDRGDDVWQTIRQQDNQNILLVWDALINLSAVTDLFSWLDTVQRFEQEVMQNVITMLQDKQLNEVILYTADGLVFRLTPALLRHWWKRQGRYWSRVDRVSA